MLTKQRFLEILYTALISAGIAMMQSFIASLTSHPEITADPGTAATIGVGLRTAWVARFHV